VSDEAGELDAVLESAVAMVAVVAALGGKAGWAALLKWDAASVSVHISRCMVLE
jgi:hypothetical protein